jgi:hypothetical protein
MTDYHAEGYRLGLQDALTGAARVICDGGPETAQRVAGYLAGHRRGRELSQRGRELSRREIEREAEAELEAGL